MAGLVAGLAAAAWTAAGAAFWAFSIARRGRPRHPWRWLAWSLALGPLLWLMLLYANIDDW